MVSFTLRYAGQLRCELTHGPSTATITTDAPLDNHGKGESFSPTDLCASSLGACMATIMGIVAERDKIRLDGLTATVEKHMAPDQPRRIGRVVVRFRMPAGIARDRRVTLEKAAQTCPVAQSLHPAIVQDVAFSYPD